MTLTKERLQACVTRGDSYALFKEASIKELQYFCLALETAKKYTEITMRDEFMLGQATDEYEHRTGQNKIAGEMSDPVHAMQKPVQPVFAKVQAVCQLVNAWEANPNAVSATSMLQKISMVLKSDIVETSGENDYNHPNEA